MAKRKKKLPEIRYPLRDDGDYFCAATHLYKFARAYLPRCEMAACQAELTNARSWCEMAAMIARRLIANGVSPEVVRKMY